MKIKTLRAAGVFMLFVGVYFVNPLRVHADALGSVTNYTIPTSNSYPYATAEGSDGNMWFTENSGNKIGKITTSGTITEYSLPYSNSGPVNIVNGPNNSLWFTEENAHQVGEITTSGSITQYNLPTGSQPDGIVAGPDGDLWVTS